MTMTVIFPTGCGRTAARLGALNHRRREGVATQTEDKDEDPDLDGKIKKRNRALSLSLNYPAAPWCIFGLTQKRERQSSNVAGKTYTVNTTQLQVILIY